MSAEATAAFRCCDTGWTIHARGRRAQQAAEDARAVALALEARLNAFDPRSDVARLAREGRVESPHVARLVRRAQEYLVRTRGAFDVALGELERGVKAHIRDATPLPVATRRASFSTEGDVVWASAPLDLNGIAKGYIVDAARRALKDAGAEGFVDGGGDIATPTGPVAIESPRDPAVRLGVLDTRWNVATSGRAKRRRGAVDHIYDPRTGRVGALHEQVTVVARRDCVEADVLATTLAVLPIEEGAALVEAWPDAEALWVDGDTMRASSGFGRHVWKA